MTSPSPGTDDDRGVVEPPNRAAVPNAFSLDLSKDGKPVRGASIELRFSMLDMEMQQETYRLTETRPGVYSHSAPALVMVGHWGLGLQIAPPGGKPFSTIVVDHATG